MVEVGSHPIPHGRIVGMFGRIEATVTRVDIAALAEHGFRDFSEIRIRTETGPCASEVGAVPEFEQLIGR